MEPYPWYPPPVHTEPQPASTLSLETLWEILGLSSFEGLDIECVGRLLSQVGSRDLSQIGSLLDASLLRSWLPTSHSGGLPIQGDSSQRAQVSALSHFCVALHCHLSELRPHMVPLFFVVGIRREQRRGLEPRRSSEALCRNSSPGVRKLVKQHSLFLTQLYNCSDIATLSTGFAASFRTWHPVFHLKRWCSASSTASASTNATQSGGT
jgi:hypothetical protein